ncbi:type I-E CRISPR-associated protein Cse2/CasB [Streptomyces sp. NPDC050743]|uniref:type I-E CRISPR-associated protein Cse2/CasB n=1 Tax=Streptomyces sp. NPDC050743 TaxID=3365634 RepID=UPI0037BDD7BA
MTASTTTTATSAPSKNRPRASDRFVAYVHRLCESKGTRAELRRGLGLPIERCNYLHRHLVPWLSNPADDGTGDRIHPETKRAHYAVAALIAARPRTARHTPAPDAADSDTLPDWYTRPNLGAALGQAVTKGVMKPATAESTLHLMSRQTTDAIHPYLPGLIRQLLSGGISVDWAVLLEDLAWWNRDRDKIATRWLESYFRTTSAETEPHDTSTENPGPDTIKENAR